MRGTEGGTSGAEAFHAERGFDPALDTEELIGRYCNFRLLFEPIRVDRTVFGAITCDSSLPSSGVKHIASHLDLGQSTSDGEEMARTGLG